MSYYFNYLMGNQLKLIDDKVQQDGLILLVFVSKNCQSGPLSSFAQHSSKDFTIFKLVKYLAPEFNQSRLQCGGNKLVSEIDLFQQKKSQTCFWLGVSKTMELSSNSCHQPASAGLTKFQKW